MTYGFQITNTAGDIIISTDDTSTALYQENTAQNGFLTTNSTASGGTTTQPMYQGFVNIPLGTDSIVFVRPRTDVSIFAFTSQSALSLYANAPSVIVDYKVFRRISELSNLETGFGINVYKADNTTLAFSSNALSARLRSALGGTASYSGESDLWVSASSCMVQVTRTGNSFYTYQFWWSGVTFGVDSVTSTVKVIGVTQGTSGPPPFSLYGGQPFLVAQLWD